LVSFLLTAGVGIGFYYLFRSFDTQIITALIAAFVAFGVAIITSVVQKKREVEFKIRERKVEAYNKIFDFMMYFLKSSTSPNGLDGAKVAEYFYDINYALVLWGSADAIIKWHEFQTMIKMQPAEADERTRLMSVFVMRNKLGELVKVIRADLGHEDKNLSLETLADLYMPIIDKQGVIQKILMDVAPPLPPANPDT
jgi:hypothetical protein